MRLNPLADPEWDARIATCPGTTFFHRRAWAQVLHATYGFRPEYFASCEGEHIAALLPIMEVDSWLTGRRGVGLPFTDECAPCGRPREIAALFAEALEWGRSRGWRHCEVRGPVADDAEPATSFFHHELDLTQASDRLLAGTDDAMRRAIRKADRSELTVEFSRSASAVEAFYDLQCKTRKRHGLPPQPRRFFENLHTHVLKPDHGCVVLAKHGECPVAAAVFLHSGRDVIYKFGASDHAYQHLRPNNLVMWRAILWHAEHGFARLSLGRTSLDNAGLRRFKLAWGARETRIDYFRYHCARRLFVTAPDASLAWHTTIVRRLPSSLSRLIGGVLYRHVA